VSNNYTQAEAVSLDGGFELQQGDKNKNKDKN